MSRLALAADVLAAGWVARGALEPLGAGHINDTWLVRDASAPVVLQRVNEHVFRQPRALMHKVEAVVRHLARRAPGFVPALLPTRAGCGHFEDAGGGIWRLWAFVGGTRTLETLDNVEQARAAGAAFARLQGLLADLDAAVPDPIEGFMQLAHYLEALDRARADAAPAEAARVEDAAAFVQPRRDLARAFTGRDRLIHGDGKVNNLLYRLDTDEVACVLDLDTVMRGHWAWDFGDLARSAAWGPDGFDLARYQAVVRGFVGEGVVDHDVDALVLAPRYVSLMLGVRFLTDHLDGDRYFKVDGPGRNLQRALVQFRLCEAMESQEHDMRRVAARA